MTSNAKINAYKWAEGYLKLGWSLLPMQFVEKDGQMVKQPMVPWKRFQTKQPIKDEVYWWLDNGWFLGLITGRLSGVCVVDDDRSKKGLADFGVISSMVVQTKSGGKHYYFKYSDGIVNTANEDIYVDVRGEGGYVVLPPFNGYKWLFPPNVENREKLTVLSEDLKKKIYKNGLGKRTEPLKLSEILGTKVGGRDNALLSYANSLCRRYPKEEWQTGVYPLLLGMNQTFEQPLTESDLTRIFNQAVKFIGDTPSIPYKSNGIKKTEIEKNKIVLYSEMTNEEMLTIEQRPTMKLGLFSTDSIFDWPTGYYVICAHPGTGKGFFALWLARKFWENGKQKSVYFTLEMSEKLIRNRLLQAWSDITKTEFDGKVSTKKAQTLLKQDIICIYPFGQNDPRYQTAENFEKDFVELYNQGYRIFIFDHIHEIIGMNINDTNQAIIERWGKMFQNIMKNPLYATSVWLFVFAQPNSAAANKSTITKTDILGSKSITHKCEFFLSLNREIKKDKDVVQIDEENRDIRVWIDKNRVSLSQYRGFWLYFAPDGNFYDSKDSFEKKHGLIKQVDSRDNYADF